MYEIFLDINGYEGLYQVSNMGNVKSLRTNKIMKPFKDECGYYRVDLRKDGKRKAMSVHRLVLSTFKTNPENKPQINHINEDKSDNRLNNLEWCTAKENCNYGTRIQRISDKNKKKVMCIETGEIYDSATSAANELSLNRGHIGSCCTGKRETHGGYHWKYC